MEKVTMREMLEAGVHFGHMTRFWNPQMTPYIFGSRDKIHIINLEKTLPLFNDALNFISHITANNSKVLFVGTKRAASKIIREEALRCGMPFVDHRWLGGMLTNYKTIRQSVKRLKELQTQSEDGTFEKITKKEALGLTREKDKLERSLGGIQDMVSLPDAIFIVDVGYENIAILEAKKLKIPVIAIVDTNNTPEGIDYVIPGNDDSRRAIALFASHVADTIIDARKHIKVEVAKEEPKAAPKKEKVVKKVAVKKVEAKKEAVAKKPAAKKPAAKKPAATKAAE